MNTIFLKAEFFRNISSRIYSILFLALAICFFVSFNTFIDGYFQTALLPLKNIDAHLVIKKSMSNNLTTEMKGIRLPFSNDIFSENEISTIKKFSLIHEINSALLLWDMDQGKFRTILGTNFNKIKSWISTGKYPYSESEIALEKHFAKFYQLKIGDSFKINGKIFSITGLIEIKEGGQLAAANIYMPLNTAQKLFSSDAINTQNLLYLKLNQNEKAEMLKDDILKIFPYLKITSSDSILESSVGMIVIAKKFSFFISTLTLLFAFAIIIKTMMFSIHERTHDIGILKAIGWTNNEVKSQIFTETFITALTGCFVGIIFNLIILYILSFIPINIQDTSEILPSSASSFVVEKNGMTLPFTIKWKLYLYAFIATIMIGVITGKIIIQKILKIKPSEVLRRI
ncbi:MAG: ABC transporter permease [Oligoflexia bacterium]|nr:ABC transporter permease [Oligoflexia bacterium]